MSLAVSSLLPTSLKTSLAGASGPCPRSSLGRGACVYYLCSCCSPWHKFIKERVALHRFSWVFDFHILWVINHVTAWFLVLIKFFWANTFSCSVSFLHSHSASPSTVYSVTYLVANVSNIIKSKSLRYMWMLAVCWFLINSTVMEWSFNPREIHNGWHLMLKW